MGNEIELLRDAIHGLESRVRNVASRHHQSSVLAEKWIAQQLDVALSGQTEDAGHRWILSEQEDHR